MKKTTLILFFCLLVHFLKAQEPSYWRLTDKDGLPSMEVYSIHQDKKGYIWIATDKGFCRYDGSTIKHYEHPEQRGNSVCEIKEDGLGRIWFKAFSGQLFYIDEQGECQHLSLPSNIKINTYFTYLARENELCLSTNKLYRYHFENESWTSDTFPHIGPNVSSAVASSLFEGANGKLVFCTYFNGEFWEIGADQNRKRGSFEQNYSTYFLPGDSAVLMDMAHTENSYAVSLAGTEEVVLDANTRLPNHSIKEGFFKGARRTLMFTHDGDILWEGTVGGAFGYKRGADGQWKQKYHILPNEHISGVLKDREGNYWFSTLKSGIFIIPSLDIVYYNIENSSLTNESLSCMEKGPDGQLFLGGSDGVVMRFDPKITELTNRYIGRNSNVYGLVLDKKREQVLFLSYGLHSIDWNAPKNSHGKYVRGREVVAGHHNIIYKEDFLVMGGNALAQVINLKDGIGEQLVLEKDYGFRVGKAYFVEGTERGDTITNYHFPNVQRVKAVWVDRLDSTTFWISANDSLYLYKDGSRKVFLDAAGDNFIATDINQSKDGTLWCGTLNKGVYKLVDGKVVKKYTKEDGLPSNNCLSLTIDGMNIWVGTDDGIARLNEQKGIVDVYNDLDGCVSNEIRDIEISNGFVWATTVRGLISFDTAMLAVNYCKPYVELVSVEVNKTVYNLTEKAELLYNENNLKFVFQTTALRGRKEVTYEYRLLGLDSTWITLPHSTNFVYLQGLIPGDFTFEVRAKNEDGITSKQPARYYFTIKLPYWQTLSYQLMMYGVVILVITGIATWRYRIYKRERDLEASMSRMRMQALQSQMNPHFVFNAMSAIQDYWIQKESKIALMYQAKFAKLMRLIFAYSKELGIHIEEELDFLKVYVSLEKIRFEGKIEVFFEVDEALLNQEIYLTPLLIQPQLENCFKHGLLHKDGKGSIVVELKAEGKYVYCSIRDNGVGREKAREYASWRKHFKKKISSLDITKERLKILNDLYGTSKNKEVFKITDLKTEDGKALGTLVEMWIPHTIT